MDALALVAYLECFSVITPPFAGVTGHVHVGQEMHFHFDQPITLTGLTTSTAYVEGETARAVPACACLGRERKELTQRGEQASVGGWVGPRCAPDWTLIDIHHFVEVIEPVYADAGKRLDIAAVDAFGCQRV